MRSNVKIFFLVFTIFVILLVPFVPTHAQKADASLDGVVVQLSDGSKVKVNFENYAIAFIMENELFDFLRGVQSEPNIVYVSSGNKYIDFNDYAIEFIFNGGDESGAINTSPPISSEIINEIKIFDGFDDNGEPILSPIASRDIYFKDIPGEIKQIIPGKYGVGIKNVDAIEHFTEINAQTILVLLVEGKDNIQLLYNSEYEGYLNPVVSGYTEEELLNAKVIVYDEQDELDNDFKVISIY
ncbi:MAG: hypothetical protein GX982_06040 [Tissierellia bacterium]|nr:hypothetical protein [Tissierellia bacterium]